MNAVIQQHQYNTAKGPYHLNEDAISLDAPASLPVRLIAFLLPQFHRIPENDAWWGPGFTEWSNTTRALPRFRGHYQPRLPGDLGFYDLSAPDMLRRQADLAKRGGIYGFCIHNYWFGGRELLQTPLRNLLADRSIDLPFCLNWANESWSRRWDGSENEVLVKQTYSAADADGYADYLLPILGDPRYIRIDGRPLVLVYRPDAIPDSARLFERWRQRLTAQGERDPFLVMVRAFHSEDPRPHGLDAAAIFPPHRPRLPLRGDRRSHRILDPRYSGHIVSYRKVAEDALAQRGDGYLLFPGVMPAWDNEARKPGRGSTVFGSTPGRYGQWLYDACLQAQDSARPDERIVFINAWNEWAEGAYLEPDRHYGFAYLAETRRVIDALSAAAPFVPTPDAPDDPLAEVKGRVGNMVRNAPGAFRRKFFVKYG